MFKYFYNRKRLPPTSFLLIFPRCDESAGMLDTDVATSALEECEVGGLTKEEDLGIFQILERLEQVTETLINR